MNNQLSSRGFSSQGLLCSRRTVSPGNHRLFYKLWEDMLQLGKWTYIKLPSYRPNFRCGPGMRQTCTRRCKRLAQLDPKIGEEASKNISRGLDQYLLVTHSTLTSPSMGTQDSYLGVFTPSLIDINDGHATLLSPCRADLYVRHFWPGSSSSPPPK